MILAELNDDVEVLCHRLKCSPEQLLAFFKNPDQYYKELSVPRRRRSKRPRTVYEVVDPLRRVQRTVALSLKPYVAKLGPWVHGFRQGHSILSNAANHSGGKRLVCTVDLHDFFGTVSVQKVWSVFCRLGAPEQVALTLARLSTFQGSLPQGGRASPALANLAADELDQHIARSISPCCVYTRYVDDLAFSGSVVPTEAEIRSWTQRFGFAVRPGSYCRKTAAAGQYVTGLFVSGGHPRAPRSVRRRIATFLRFAAKYDVASAAQKTFLHGKRASNPSAALAYVRGVINSVRSIEPDLIKKWTEQLDQITAPKEVTSL